MQNGIPLMADADRRTGLLYLGAPFEDTPAWKRAESRWVSRAR
jgi:hypothetical protein